MYLYCLALGIFANSIGLSCSDTSVARPCAKGEPDFFCPSPPTVLEVYIPHEQYCNRYYKCLYGLAHSMQCPPGTYFNPRENICSRDKSFCRRPKPCSIQVPGCLNCVNQFVKLSHNAAEFGVCDSEGKATRYKCPEAFDPRSRKYVPLQFINGRCEAPARSNCCLDPEINPTVWSRMRTTSAKPETICEEPTQGVCLSSEGTTTTEGITSTTTTTTETSTMTEESTATSEEPTITPTEAITKPTTTTEEPKTTSDEITTATDEPTTATSEITTTSEDPSESSTTIEEDTSTTAVRPLSTNEPGTTSEEETEDDADEESTTSSEDPTTTTNKVSTTKKVPRSTTTAKRITTTTRRPTRGPLKSSMMDGELLTTIVPLTTTSRPETVTGTEPNTTADELSVTTTLKPVTTTKAQMTTTSEEDTADTTTKRPATTQQPISDIDEPNDEEA